MSYRLLSKGANGINHYKITIELGYDLHGKRRRLTKNVTCTNVEVKQKEAELKSKNYHCGEKVQVKLNDYTFYQMSELFLNKFCQAKEVTKKKYRKLLERINSYIGKEKIQKLTPLKLHDLYYKDLVKGKNKARVKNSTLLEYYKIVSLVLNKAVDYKLLNSNPNLRVVRPKKETPNVNVYDEKDVIKLLKCLENESLKWKTIITLAFTTGCRRGELCALKWQNIDFEKKVLTIENSLKVVDGKPYTDGPKTKNAHRKILLGDVIIKMLQEYKEWQDSYIKVMGNKWEENDYVFPSKYGSYMHPDSYNTMLSRIVTKYKLKPISFHGLRHTSCSILVNNNINSRTIIDRMGHSEELFMLMTYAKSFDESHIQSAKIFDNVLSTVNYNGT